MTGDPLTVVRGIAAPLLRANIDTDAIAPSRVRMTALSKSGYAKALFANWRFDAQGREIADFVLNREPYRRACVLVAGANFGCGSSRETAVWALRQSGFRAVIAPSFGAIFEANCYRNGLLPLALSPAEHAELTTEIFDDQQVSAVEVDLERCRVGAAHGPVHHFAVDERGRRLLLEGLDTVGETLLSADLIENFRARDRLARPWIYRTAK
ncbi:3-isopropylmalate dehydratase small subunit [Nocardia terpenica]|uniref:3-isopropylmalate dehydratase small subunit n=1 Tax=Nocardia terpenica TaxID=455432 RepID=A0A164MMF4_9NOCA|nr:3-isopropylmalate dehydratase small subunit [Nocardia terpenica]KZM73492.1 3-isopropylmalate dehydratase [Nocardia terpenica]NQE87319.1 3-isopropylmalate dehydratase small subunit [Nocardia terpenica]